MPTRKRSVPARKRKAKQTEPAAPGRPAYLKRISSSVRLELAEARTLASTLADEELLTREERRLIVQQALILFEQNYAHLPLKRALHAVDPVRRLQLLLQEIESGAEDIQDSDIGFHNEMTDIFMSVRDLHTNYLLPHPYAGYSAFLPFMVEDCIDEGRCIYLVSHLVEGFNHPTFRTGVEIVYWNGMPIERAVRNNGQRFAGSNRDARHARGVQTLTTRSLRVMLPPDEDWVVVGYRDERGEMQEHRFDWIVTPAPESAMDDAEASGFAAYMGVDLQQQLVQRVRSTLFAPRARERRRAARAKVDRGEALGALESAMPHVIEARPITTASGTFGYVRLRTFSVEPEALVNEFLRLVSALPKEGLIIDVRGNGGGVIHSGEYLLQLLTPRRIEPEPVQFISTPLNLRLCERNGADSPFADLSEWTDSMRRALQTGAAFSAGFPISSPATCNVIGQRYFGPVVLITDALCYSTTDIFAAGFQDHEIGKILGTDLNTGAGGANVWEHGHLLDYVMSGDDSVYRALPRGAGMRVSMRRSLRVGKRSGTPVEDIGVEPDQHHLLTRRDVLDDNVDLKDAAGAILGGMPVREMTVKALRLTGRKARLRVTTAGMQRLDAYVSDRPVASLEPIERVMEFDVEARAPGGDVVEIRGFDGDLLVARFRVTWDEIAASAPRKTRRGTSPAKRARARKRPLKNLRTPNVGDDASAVAELAVQSFGGSALEADVTPAAATTWRAAECLLQLRRQVDVLAPRRKKSHDGMIGDAAHATRTSDHNPWVRDGGMGVVTAYDITHDPASGCDAGRIADVIRASRDERVKYIIWNRRIASASPINGQPAWAWRAYTGANPHSKHVHISVKPDKVAYDSKKPWSV